MLRKHFKILFFVSSWAYLPACSTTPRVQERRRERIEVCLPDPRNDSLQCVLKDRSSLTRPFQSLPLGDYVCFKLDEINPILVDE